MKKRITAIAAALSLLPIGQPLVMGTGAALPSAAMMLSLPESVKAESARSYNKSGMDKHYSGDHYGAISDYTKAIKLNKKIPEYYYNRGLSKELIKDYNGAIKDFNQALKLRPKYANAYRDRALSKSRLGDYYGSISDGNKAIDINTNYDIAI